LKITAQTDLRRDGSVNLETGEHTTKEPDPKIILHLPVCHWNLTEVRKQIIHLTQPQAQMLVCINVQAASRCGHGGLTVRNGASSILKHTDFGLVRSALCGRWSIRIVQLLKNLARREIYRQALLSGLLCQCI
jgi:hypothetical protein